MAEYVGMEENKYKLHDRHLSQRSRSAMKVWLFSYILANLNEPDTQEALEMWLKKV